ncbi:hypothetical protein EV175_000289 [Coemansia sp. RSA 1933]|nr:hypothetical protein EV175_000289 [Coemansia sp. RSA 1933]
MDLGYDEPFTRYGSSSSDSEDESTTAASPVTRNKTVVRLSRAFERRSSTVVISLVPLAGSGYRQVGVVYAPVSPQGRTKLPLGDAKCMQTNGGLARILVDADDGQTVYVVASGDMPAAVQHAWVRALGGGLSIERIVLVDALDTGGAAADGIKYRSPAVLASTMVVGLAAAILNYADTYGVPCRHVRTDSAVAPALDIDALFAIDTNGPQSKQLSILADTAGRRETSASLYV